MRFGETVRLRLFLWRRATENLVECTLLALLSTRQQDGIQSGAMKGGWGGSEGKLVFYVAEGEKSIPRQL